MIIETELTLKDYISFCYEYLYTHPFYRLLTLYGILMTVGLIFWRTDDAVILTLQILSILIILIVVPLRVRRNAERRYDGSGLLNEKKKCEFTNEKISVIGTTFKSEVSLGKDY